MGDDGSVSHDPWNLNVERDDQREVVRLEGIVSVIPTSGTSKTAHRFSSEEERSRVLLEKETGHNLEENHEVNVEEYITTTMVSTTFHAVVPDSARNKDRKKVHFVECDAINEGHPPRHPPVAAPSSVLSADPDRSSLPGDQDERSKTGQNDDMQKGHAENRNWYETLTGLSLILYLLTPLNPVLDTLSNYTYLVLL